MNPPDTQWAFVGQHCYPQGDIYFPGLPPEAPSYIKLTLCVWAWITQLAQIEWSSSLHSEACKTQESKMTRRKISGSGNKRQRCYQLINECGVAQLQRVDLFWSKYRHAILLLSIPILPTIWYIFSRYTPFGDSSYYRCVHSRAHQSHAFYLRLPWNDCE